MPVTVGEVVTVLRVIAGALEDTIPAPYGKADFDLLVEELKILEILFQRALKIESPDLQQLLLDAKIKEELEDIQRQLQEKEECPVARNDPKMNKLWNDLRKQGKTDEEAYDVAIYRTLVQCVAHPADSQVKDSMKFAGDLTKRSVKSVWGAPLAPLVGLIGAGVGAAFASEYNSHKREVSDKLKDLIRKMKSVGRKVTTILLDINTEDTALIKKMLMDKSK